MIKEATAMTVRQNLGELLNGIQYGNDQIIITKGGKPVAAIVDNALFDKIRLLRREFDKLSGQLAIAYKDVDEATAQREIDAAVKSVRKR